MGIGMLVDNAIVVLENISRKLEEGTPLAEAAVLGAAEVGGAISSSTATTIGVCLPIVYLHGAAGDNGHAASQAEAAKLDDGQQAGYQETEHVKTYYELARY